MTKPVDLGCRLAGRELPSCLLNEPAAGPRTPTEARAAAASELGAVVTSPLSASTSPAPPTAFRSELFTLSRPGAEDLDLEAGIDVVAAVREGGKAVIATLTGTRMADFERGLGMLADSEPALLQLDLSRRTASSSRYLTDRRVLGLRHEFVHEVMALARREVDIPVGIRQPIWLDPQNVAEGMAVAKDAGVAFVVIAAPIPIGLLVDVDEERAIPGPATGESSLALGRLSGPAVKPVNLAELDLAYGALGSDLALIGSGGIRDDGDAMEYLLAGASAVEVATLSEHGQDPWAALPRIAAGLRRRVGAFDETSVRGVVGRLRTNAGR